MTTLPIRHRCCVQRSSKAIGGSTWNENGLERGEAVGLLFEVERPRGLACLPRGWVVTDSPVGEDAGDYIVSGAAALEPLDNIHPKMREPGAANSDGHIVLLGRATAEHGRDDDADRLGLHRERIAGFP
jgi:hypothetical protein